VAGPASPDPAGIHPETGLLVNMAEGWWRLLRRAAFAGQTFVDTDEIAYAVDVATTQLNTHAKP
jgi:hypothetical protein